MAAALDSLPRSIARNLAALRARGPRVQCLTNTVAQPITTNLLLAAGVRVSLATHPDEVAAMTHGADALLINLGTLDEARVVSIPRALAAFDRVKKPVVLDPVFVEHSPLRRGLAETVIAGGHVIVRGNATEMAAIAELAANAAVTATTGATDTVSDGRTTVRIANGHPHMARVTGMGCAAGALIAAFAAVEADRLVATVGALTGLGIAGEIAAERAHGPGTFAAHIIDALATLDAATIYARARLS